MARTKKQITVLLGSLVKPLVTKKCNVGTTLSKFLKDNDIQWGSAVRVNGETENKTYKLRNKDVITTIGTVSGGC